MTRPRLLDLFCGAGGASVGYYHAGFDVVGVDIKPQPHYPFQAMFMAHDAIELLNDLADYGPEQVLGDAYGPISAIHASPPCQDHTRQYVPREHGTGWMLAASRDLLSDIGLPWVIENVPGAPMRADYKLCGCMFDLPYLKRERWFEASWQPFEMRPPCNHPEQPISITGHGAPTGTWRAYGSVSLRRAGEVMGIDWMTRTELSQAIPPAYTEHIGRQLLAALAVTS